MPERGLPDLSALVAFDERLREVPADREALERAVAAADKRLAATSAVGDDQARLRLLGYLGNAERVLGNHPQAIAHLREALRLAEHLGDRGSKAAALIRLGEAHRCADEFEEAERLLREAAEATRGLPLHDFALQHLGKCLTDQARFDDAIRSLSEALLLRQKKSDSELIASTELALERARRLCDAAYR
jgi:HTH-type transcriptional regulator, pleiotropic regulator of extracellular virulence genes